MKNIVYFEDNFDFAMNARQDLEGAFPNYKFIHNIGERGCVDEVLGQVGGMERIALVFTDGDLIDGVKGWEVLQELKDKGYKGPALYTGFSDLPLDKKDLYLDRADKDGSGLVAQAKKYLE